MLFYQGFDYTSNTKKLLGTRWRDVHCLQLEGYKVIVIDYYDWYKMSMRDEESKLDYVRNLFEDQAIKVPKRKRKRVISDKV